MSHDTLKKLIGEKNEIRNQLRDKNASLSTLIQKISGTPADERHKFLSERAQISADLRTLELTQTEIKTKIKLLKDACEGILVTEHAILRYFERVLGFDLEEIKSKIVPKKTADQIRILQSGVFPVENYKLRVKKGTVVTLVLE